MEAYLRRAAQPPANPIAPVRYPKAATGGVRSISPPGVETGGAEGGKAPPEGECTPWRQPRGLPPPTVPGMTHRSHVCHSANLHRLFEHTRSIGITLNRTIRVSVFGSVTPKTNRGLPCSSECHTI